MVFVPYTGTLHLIQADRRAGSEDTFKGTSSVPQERVQQLFDEQTVDVPQFAEETVEMVRLVPQERLQLMYEQVVELFSGEKEFLTKMDELRTQLDEMSETNDALRVQISRIWDQVGDRVAESGRFDPCLLLNKQLGVLIEEKKGYSAALDRLMSEHQRTFLNHVKGLNLNGYKIFIENL